jgi:hypothetical protein
MGHPSDVDEGEVEIPCGYCRNPTPRVRLHRLGNRLLCPTCFNALEESGKAGGIPDSTAIVGPDDARSLLRQSLAAVGAGVLFRTLLFLPLFLWARASDTGAGALKGAVGGDLFGWAVLSVLLWPFRRTQVGLGAIVQLVLIGLYLQRETLFEITSDTETTAISVLFFFGVLLLKTGLWSANHILEITGVTETS